jgi:23S rRNA pseudouridine1911/1915/1917 synthase
MHRLDREVSGLMVIAKTQDAYDNLKQQFASHTVEKRYLALVHGFVKEDYGDLKFRIGRSKSKGRMAARPEMDLEKGKAAWTHYKTLQRFAAAALLELTILSGRTHQIRTHLLAFNHPVMGDPLYGRKEDDKRHKPKRLLLQSVHLMFQDPATGGTRSFDLKPDPAFDEIMKRLTPEVTV